MEIYERLDDIAQLLETACGPAVHIDVNGAAE